MLSKCLLFVACRSGLNVRRAKSAAKTDFLLRFFELELVDFLLRFFELELVDFLLRFFELELVGWCAMSVTRVFHEGSQAQWM